MENQVHFQPFLDHLRFEKRYSSHTYLAYQTDLTDFFDFLSTTFDGLLPEQILHAHVRSWLASLKERKLSAKSINRKISTLKSFFKYQVKIGVLRQSPMTKVVSPKTEKRLPNFVAEADMDRLLTQVEFPDTWCGRTDRLLLLLFYQTGMRLSEAIGLRERQLDFANRQLRVLGKGGKERIIPLQAALLTALQAYLQERQTTFAELPEQVLVNAKGLPLQPRAVYTSVKGYLSQVTTIQKRSPHVLRHSFATHLMGNGAEINAVKDLLGHSSLAATQVYTHTSIEKLKNIHQKAHPKA